MSIPGPETREWLLAPNGMVRGRTGQRGAVLSGLYDSRRNPGGIGFPSCSRELARLAPNDKDPHDYYAEIGVARDASETEIRHAVRTLLIKHHPDTGDGDTAKFQRVHNIGKVLLDPESRIKYNRTPPGMRLMDAVYAQEIVDAGLDPLTQEAIIDSAVPSATIYQRVQGRFDFFAMDHRGGDSMLANMWYHHLVYAAGECGYRHVIKVMLTDSLHPSYNSKIHVMGIPRSWEPTWALAVVLFRRAGFNPPD